MKRLSSGLKTVLALLGLGMLVFVLAFFFEAQKNRSGTGNLQSPLLTVTPVPHLPTDSPLGIRMQVPSSSAVSAPSVTPIPISKTTDLAPELRQEDKVQVYVKRADGTFEVFWIRPREKASKVIPLQPGDTIFDTISPASLMGHQPPLATPTNVSPVNTPAE